MDSDDEEKRDKKIRSTESEIWKGRCRYKKSINYGLKDSITNASVNEDMENNQEIYSYGQAFINDCYCYYRRYFSVIAKRKLSRNLNIGSISNDENNYSLNDSPNLCILIFCDFVDYDFVIKDHCEMTNNELNDQLFVDLNKLATSQTLENKCSNSVSVDVKSNCHRAIVNNDKRNRKKKRKKEREKPLDACYIESKGNIFGGKKFIVENPNFSTSCVRNPLDFIRDDENSPKNLKKQIFEMDLDKCDDNPDFVYLEEQKTGLLKHCKKNYNCISEVVKIDDDVFTEEKKNVDITVGEEKKCDDEDDDIFIIKELFANKPNEDTNNEVEILYDSKNDKVSSDLSGIDLYSSFLDSQMDFRELVKKSRIFSHRKEKKRKHKHKKKKRERSMEENIKHKSKKRKKKHNVHKK